MINFKDKKILITGATGGIGKEMVKKFVSLDGDVLATGTKVENLENLKKEIIEKKNDKKIQNLRKKSFRKFKKRISNYKNIKI